jgi:hypothetical protein
MSKYLIETTELCELIALMTGIRKWLMVLVKEYGRRKQRKSARKRENMKNLSG